MQKEILEGVPYWKDKSNILYSFEPDKKNLISLGLTFQLDKVISYDLNNRLFYMK